MRLKEVQEVVSELPRHDLQAFSRWFDEFRADVWDRQIEDDARSGQLDAAARRASADFVAGRCKPL